VLYNRCGRINEPLRISSISHSICDVDTWIFFQKIAHVILYKTLWKELFAWLTMEFYPINTVMLQNDALSNTHFYRINYFILSTILDVKPNSNPSFLCVRMYSV
jgi:hypothetical protein